jgi:predicted TIM-barrel fold metal-dependent hydrolase
MIRSKRNFNYPSDLGFKLMIIDSHTHLWPGGDTNEDLAAYFKKRNIFDKISSILTAEGLLRKMDDNGIERSIVASIALRSGMGNEDLMKVNRHVIDEVKKSDGRLTGLCTIDPFDGEKSISTLKHCIEKLGFQGLKLHPCFQKFYPNDQRLHPIYEAMQDYGKPILFHTGGLGIVPHRDSYGSPLYLDDVGSDFPGLKIIMGHGGRMLYDQAAILLRKHKNMYADISTNFGRWDEFSFLPLEWLLYKVKVWAGSLDRVLFGSDYPFYFQDETLQIMDRAKKSLNNKHKKFITDEDINKIKYENAKNLLGSLDL